MRADKKLTTLTKKELLELITDIYIDFQLQCDTPNEYEIMTEHLREINKTQVKYSKENIEIILNK